MQLSETIKLYLSKEQRLLIVQTMNEYISTVNGLVSDAVNGGSINKYTSKDVKANLPSALSNQCIRDAKSIIRKYNKEMYKTEETNKLLKKQGKMVFLKEPSVPILKRPCCYINNQNFRVKDDWSWNPCQRQDQKQKDWLTENGNCGCIRIK